MAETILHSLSDYDAGIAAYPRVLLFKHSPICAVSAAARAEYETFRAAEPGLPTLFVDVIAERATARALATACGVQHQSPQAILFAGGRPVWHAAHGAITAAALALAWAAY
ncbi:MAG TPA: monothiol bacilliredoxin BrxC family protein [Planctomycetota bacterium]|nr:monothiol bacilliredoxin BrxC family protein [Planctomycetota bacterium]